MPTSGSCGASARALIGSPDRLRRWAAGGCGGSAIVRRWGLLLVLILTACVQPARDIPAPPVADAGMPPPGAPAPRPPGAQPTPLRPPAGSAGIAIAPVRGEEAQDVPATPLMTGRGATARVPARVGQARPSGA